VSPGKICWDCC